MYTSAIDAAQQRYSVAQEQELTGQQINTPSDNPGGTVEVLNMQGIESQLNQFQSNLSTASGFLGATNNALGTAQNIMQSANQLALQASNSTTDAATMQTLATQVSQLQQQLVSVANEQSPDGQYLFAGQQTSTQPFTVSNGTLNYNGDGNSITVPVGPSQTMAVNTPGSPLFTQAYQALQALESDLQSGNSGNITNNDLAALKTSMTAMSSAQGEAGAKSDEVQSLTNDNTRRIQELTSQISGVLDVNVTTAATNYAQAQSALQNALSVVSSGASLSLSGFLSTTNA